MHLASQPILFIWKTKTIGLKKKVKVNVVSSVVQQQWITPLHFPISIIRKQVFFPPLRCVLWRTTRSCEPPRLKWEGKKCARIMVRSLDVMRNLSTPWLISSSAAARRPICETKRSPTFNRHIYKLPFCHRKIEAHNKYDLLQNEPNSSKMGRNWRLRSRYAERSQAFGVCAACAVAARRAIDGWIDRICNNSIGTITLKSWLDFSKIMQAK